jgi:hypothetical protein
MTAKTIVSVISDTHLGSTCALMLPEWTNDDKQTIKASLPQMWLLECWNEYWNYVKALCGIRGKSRKARLVVIHLGDIVEGNHHGSSQLMPNLEDQESMAEEMLRPLAAMADGGFYCARGTEAHAGDAAQSEVRICKEIGARACEWTLLLDVDGVLFDCAHHGRSGNRPWTSSAAGLAAEVALDAATHGQPIPNYVLRGHTHTYDDGGLKVTGIRAITVPSWQLHTAYGYKVAGNRRSDIGGMVFSDGIPDFSRIRYMAAPGQKRIIKV